LSESRGIRNPIVVTRFAQVKDDPAIDLVLSLLRIEVSQRGSAKPRH
jgi:hypothetical protein